MSALLALLMFATPSAELRPSDRALVIAIDRYPPIAEWEPLEASVADARRLADFLRDDGFAVAELYDGQATNAAIRAALEDLAETAGDGSRVTIYFSGHGWEDQRGYLVPFDGRRDNPTLLPMSAIRDAISKMTRPQSVLVLLNACYSGLLAGTDHASPLPSTASPRQRARLAITAGSGKQLVRQKIFPTALINGLAKGTADTDLTRPGRGDGAVTVLELFEHLQQSASLSPRPGHPQDPSQTPSLIALPGHDGGSSSFGRPIEHAGGQVALQVESEPPGAQINVNGWDTRLKTPSTLSVAPGTYALRVGKLPEYLSEGRHVTVAVGAPPEFFHLRPAKASIVVASTPPGASVLLDGVPQPYVTPTLITEIEPGQHTLVVDGPERKSFNLRFTAGQQHDSLTVDVRRANTTPLWLAGSGGVTSAVGLAGIVLARTYFADQVETASDEFAIDDAIRTGHGVDIAGWGLLGVGLTLAATGALLLLIDD